MISRPPWNSCPNTVAPWRWIDLGQPREAGDRRVGVRGQLRRRVAGRRVDAGDLDDDQPRAAPRPRLLVGDQPVRDQAVVGHDGVVPGRHDPVADRRAADRERREQAGERARRPCARRGSRAGAPDRAKPVAPDGRARSDRSPDGIGAPAAAIVPPWTGRRETPVHRRRRIAAIVARWLGRIGYRDAWDLQKALAARPRRRRDPATSCCSSSTRPCSPSGAARTSRTCSRRPAELDARGHRAPPRRARRRGDLPRPGPAGRLPDRPARRPRAAPAPVRPRARGGA